MFMAIAAIAIAVRATIRDLSRRVLFAFICILQWYILNVSVKLKKRNSTLLSLEFQDIYSL
jgi:hypothetical protein